MRVLVCTDAVGGLSSAEAGTALGRAFRRAGAAGVAVVPAASGGQALAAALAALGRPLPVLDGGGPQASAFVPTASSGLDAGVLREALEMRPDALVLDLTRTDAPDGGAGLLAALGASGASLTGGALGLQGLDALDLGPARALLGTTRLIGVIPDAQRDDQLLGLRGLASRRGRETGADPADMLAVDTALSGLAARLGVTDRPGLGAAGGAGLAVLGLGGELTTGVDLCLDVAGASRSAAQADLVVTGADTIGFVDRGGPVVAELSGLAERALRPCIAVARRVDVSARELRTFGLEAAHAVGGAEAMASDELTERTVGVARTWTW
ncbi:glycerate kinase [Nigerium massiliense]|uniref:glycerate kinase n=1 Tax=Nigerium massiliense TaxID=1522317 RepID=UPI00058F9597|nr:glycerate kinase [Nigerium massiliense]